MSFAWCFLYHADLRWCTFHDFYADTPAAGIGRDIDADTPAASTCRDVDADTPAADTGRDIDADTSADACTYRDVDADAPTNETCRDADTAASTTTPFTEQVTLIASGSATQCDGGQQESATMIDQLLLTADEDSKKPP